MGKKVGKIQRVVIFVIMLFFVFIILIPFVIMFLTSLKTPAEIQSAEFVWLPSQWRFANYVEAMQSSAWELFFFNSFVITISSVIISLIINSLAGFAFARMYFRGRNFLFFLALVGMMIPIQVTMLPNFILMKYFPLIGGNDLFGQGGTGMVNTYIGLLMPSIAGAFGVFLFRQFFMNFPLALDDAAKIDGLTRLQTFFRIYIPLSKPVFATMVVLKATATWNDYSWPLIIVTDRKYWTVQLALSTFKTEFQTRWDYIMATTTLILIPVLILYLLMQRYFVEGIVTTGIKG